MINNGILELGKVGTARFRVDLIPTTNHTSRPGYPMKFKYITVHDTDNKRVGTGARMHTQYVDNAPGYLSWHFSIDETYIYQELPIKEAGYHAGDQDGPGNRLSIGVELCVNKGGNWKQTRENGIKLIAFLLVYTGKAPDIVVPHQKWSGKYCPRKILDEGWDSFIHDIQHEYYSAIIHYHRVSDWAKDSWLKAYFAGVNDGRDPEARVTEEQLMVFFDRLKLLE